MATSDDLRQIFTAGRPLIEEWLDIGEQIAALREVATSKGLDWSQLKALMKAQVQDERDETGSGKRVARIVEKAEFASAYADMLGLANMNEENFSSDDFDAETGEIHNQDQPETTNTPSASAPHTGLSSFPEHEVDASSGSIQSPSPTSSQAGDSAGEGVLPLSPATHSDEAIPHFLRRGAAA